MGVRKLSNIGGWTSKTSYTSMLAGNAVFEPWDPSGAYDSIATATLASDTASITFSGIPSTYTHLQIRGILRSASGTTAYSVAIRANGDTGSNYSNHLLSGDGSSASVDYIANFNQPYLLVAPGPSNAGQIYGGTVLDILDYKNTNKYKTIRSLVGYDANGSGQTRISSALWMNTSAITSFTIFGYNSGILTAGTSLALYGIKGA